MKLKKFLTKRNILIGVTALFVIAAAIVALILFTPKKSIVEMPEINKIEIEEKWVQVSDEDVRMFKEDSLYRTTKFIEAEENETAENGDMVVVSYVGRLEDGTKVDEVVEEPFILGEGYMLEGFESSILGHKDGDIVLSTITFDEDYENPEDEDPTLLAGKVVSYEIKIKQLRKSKPEEYNDEWVQKYSEMFTDIKCNNDEEFTEAAKTYLREKYISEEIEQYILSIGEIKRYDESLSQRLTEYFKLSIQKEAYSYQMKPNELAKVRGSNSAKELAIQTNKEYQDYILRFQEIIKRYNIKTSQKDYEKFKKWYYDKFQYTDDYPYEKFEVSMDEDSEFIFKKVDYNRRKCVEFLRDKVEIIK